jgi:hypothetical protein
VNRYSSTKARTSAPAVKTMTENLSNTVATI